MPRPLLPLEPFLGQTLTRDDDVFRVIARQADRVVVQPDAGGDTETYVLGTPPFARFEVPDA